MRPLCICGLRPAAINYKKNNKTFYRKKCETCTRYGGTGHGIPKWKHVGYVKKDQCEKCGFKSKHKEQFNVFHIDGANCQRIMQKQGVRWKQGDLVPDF